MRPGLPKRPLEVLFIISKAVRATDIIIKLRGLIIGEVLRSYLLEYWESRPAVLWAERSCCEATEALDVVPERPTEGSCLTSASLLTRRSGPLALTHLAGGR